MDILEINEEKQIVKCEPLVTVERLVESLTAKGWIIPIVPEIGDLTVGGLVMGGGIETTSHKYGLWQNICMSYEMVIKIMIIHQKKKKFFFLFFPQVCTYRY